MFCVSKGKSYLFGWLKTCHSVCLTEQPLRRWLYVADTEFPVVLFFLYKSIFVTFFNRTSWQLLPSSVCIYRWRNVTLPRKTFNSKFLKGWKIIENMCQPNAKVRYSHRHFIKKTLKIIKMFRGSNKCLAYLPINYRWQHLCNLY